MFYTSVVMGQNPTEEDVLRMMADVSPEGDHKISKRED